MASNNRRKKRERRPNLPQQSAVRQPRTRSGAGSSLGRGAAVLEEEDLPTMYAHVRRDMIRIAVLGVVLCAAIYASQFVAL